jgi:hypothetical protein
MYFGAVTTCSAIFPFQSVLPGRSISTSFAINSVKARVYLYRLQSAFAIKSG